MLYAILLVVVYPWLCISILRKGVVNISSQEHRLLNYETGVNGTPLGNHTQYKEFLASRGQFVRTNTSGGSAGVMPCVTKGFPRREDEHQWPAEGRLFFLFMAIRGIIHEDHWRAFFEGVPPRRYAIYLHCKRRAMCDLNLFGSNPLSINLVEAVNSSYCVDLVSPMVQLLLGAVKESNSVADKFLFISESTLPVKPFALVYSSLMADQNSDFCFLPPKDWQTLGLKRRKKPWEHDKAILVKHSQWVVLSQKHARAMISNWNNVKMPAEQWAIPIWRAPSGQTRSSLLGTVETGVWSICADEWAVFATIYGAIEDTGQQQVIIPGIGSNEVKLHASAEDSNFVQGVCHTFAFWGYEHYGAGTLMKDLTSDGQTRMSCYPKCKGTHPAEFVAVGDRAVWALRWSGFLFARKFSQDVLSLDQFKRIIMHRNLSGHPQWDASVPMI